MDTERLLCGNNKFDYMEQYNHTEMSYSHVQDWALRWSSKCCIGFHSSKINSLAPGRFQFNFRLVIFKLNLVNGGWGISYEIALRWMPLDLTDDKSTLVQVMAWCRQATSHYLSQGWPRSMSTNGVTRPQWVNVLLTVMLKKERKKKCLNISVYIVLNQYTKLCLLYVKLIIIHTFKNLN